MSAQTQTHPLPCLASLALLFACKGDPCTDSDCPMSPAPVVAVTLQTSCATTSDGELLCWGYPALDEGPPTEPVDLLVGGSEMCAAGVGEIYCWGTIYQPNHPVQREQVEALDVGMMAACYLDTQGLPTCWGGEWTGDWLLDEPATPLKAIAVATNEIACGLPADGSNLLCWGNEDHAIIRIAPDGPFEQLTAGYRHLCGLDAEGFATCWGDLYLMFEDVPTDRRFKTLAAGEGGVCGIGRDGRTDCWGHGVTEEGMPAPPDEEFVQVSMGAAHACGVTVDHRVRCWGAEYMEESGALDVPESLR